MRTNKKKIIVFAILTILVVPILINHLIKSKYASEYSNREKAVVIIENDNAGETEARIIEISDCRDKVVDYNSDKRTILYINTDNQVVEKIVDTGKTQIIDIEEVRNSLPIEIGKIDKEIRNLQYGPGVDKLSFVYEGVLYLYNLQSKELDKVVECRGTRWTNTYEWKNDKELFAAADNAVEQELFLNNLAQHEKIFLCYGVKTLVWESKNNKIYAIIEEPKPHAFGFELKYKLAEINVEDGSKKELQPIESDNFTINNDENFLYYVEQKAEQRKYKLYRINLETGEQDCIYKTNKIIVGIVVE